MPDYSKGKIYCIRAPGTDEVYIGSTTQALSQRMAAHRLPSNKAVSKKLIDKGDAYIELIEDFPCEKKEQLNRREGEIIRKTPNVLNRQVAGRTNNEYRQENKERISEVDKRYYQENKQKYNEYSKKYYQENKEKWVEYTKKKAKAKVDGSAAAAAPAADTAPDGDSNHGADTPDDEGVAEEEDRDFRELPRGEE